MSSNVIVTGHLFLILQLLHLGTIQKYNVALAVTISGNVRIMLGNKLKPQLKTR